MFKKYETQLAGRTLSIETGKIAELANGNVVVWRNSCYGKCNSSKRTKRGS